MISFTRQEKKEEEYVWKIRILIRGSAALHAVSTAEPTLTYGTTGKPTSMTATLITNIEDGDEIAYVDWSEAVAISWRKARKTEWEAISKNRRSKAARGAA